MRLTSLLLSAAAFSVATPAMAEPLTLERIFASPSLNGAGARGVALSPDGSLLTMLRAREDDQTRYDLWALDTSTGEWRMLVDSEKVGSGAELTEAEKMQRERARIGSLKGIVTYQWSDDGQRILVPIDGDLYLTDLEGNVTRLTDSKEGELNPKISPDNGYVSFVRNGQLFVGKIGEEPRAITPDETANNVRWGEAEFVAQEEMSRLTGYWWSPNDRHLAVQRFDETPVKIVTRTSIGGGGTTTYDQRYPAAGTDNVLVDLFVINPDTGARVEVDLGDEEDIYLARVDWAPDGSALYVQRQNRAQTVLDMLKVDPATGASEIYFTETAAEGHWTNLSYNYKFLDDGSLIWWSERDGYGHLYHRTTDGAWRQLTSGAWVVKGIDGIDQDKGLIYFSANRETPLESHGYVLDYRTAGAEPTLLTEPGYTYGISMDKKAQRMIIGRSNDRTPGQSYLADTAANRIAWINENALDESHPYYPYLDSHEPAEYGTFTASDGTELDYMMIKPANMEPGKRYPVFFQHYGGPHAQQVAQGWKGALWQWVVDQGYIFFEIENRGGNYRGVEFEKPIYRAMGGIEVDDQRDGANFLKSLDYVDGDRIAINGWSYGGYLTLKQLAADPGLYAAGVAGAPVSMWELYDTHYTERYMGDPREVPEAYEKSSTLYQAERISDPLLLIHGMSDDNVVLDNSTAMAAKLQAEAIPFQMMFYPGYTHRVGGEKVSVHLWTTIMNFLEQNGVEGGPR